MKFLEIFQIFLKLGMTSFGGPVAHLGYFHSEFVDRRKWLDEVSYADLVALCQFLPGPASSQVGMAIGFSQGGYLGALAAWLGFTLPSALLMTLLALGISFFSGPYELNALHGLKIVAVAVVAQAIWQMGRKLTPNLSRQFFAALIAVVALTFSNSFMQIGLIFVGALFGIVFLREPHIRPPPELNLKSSRKAGLILLTVFFSILIALPLIAARLNNLGLKQFDSFYRTGSLVFGGGHVVLPLLKNEVVTPGWVSEENFLAGYGAAQAIPGPLFSLSAYLGAVSSASANPLWGALLCLFALFLPAYLLVIGVLPFWNNLRKYKNINFALKGVNASVVGLLVAAFVNPVCSHAILHPRDILMALLFLLLLTLAKAPSWTVVLLSVLLSFIF